MWTLIWLTGAILTWFPVSRAIYKGQEPHYNMETEDAIFAAFGGIFASVFWPVAWLVLIGANFIRRADEEVDQ